MGRCNSSAAWFSRPSTRSWMRAINRCLNASEVRTSKPNWARSKRATRIGVTAQAPAKKGAPNTIGRSPSQSPGSLRAIRRSPSG